MDVELAVLMNEARYAERLCQRTARLYRRLQTAGTFATVVGGSAALSALADGIPHWVAIAGASVFTVFGAALVAIRPADKAAANETDMRRFAKLRTAMRDMDAPQARTALDQARESDIPEVELLRDVAFNDVAREVGRPEEVAPLTMPQRLLAALA